MITKIFTMKSKEDWFSYKKRFYFLVARRWFFFSKYIKRFFFFFVSLKKKLFWPNCYVFPSIKTMFHHKFHKIFIRETRYCSENLEDSMWKILQSTLFKLKSFLSQKNVPVPLASQRHKISIRQNFPILRNTFNMSYTSIANHSCLSKESTCNEKTRFNVKEVKPLS